MKKLIEIWKPIPEWENLYLISNLGRINRLRRKLINKSGKRWVYPEGIMKLQLNHKNKYIMVTLSETATKRHETKCVHRIVAEVFIPNPLNLPDVNHLKTKNDITVNDLEWTTKSNNMKDAFRRGLAVVKKDEHSHWARRLGMYLNGILIKEYKSIKAANKEGFSYGAIYQAIKNNWKCGGYTWKYLDKRKWPRSNSRVRKIGAFNDGIIVKEYDGMESVWKDGHDKSNIYKALKNQNTTSGGFVWKYLDNKKTA